MKLSQYMAHDYDELSLITFVRIRSEMLRAVGR